jgi:pyrroloquinoline quinone biosynthesis protein B
MKKLILGILLFFCLYSCRDIESKEKLSTSPLKENAPYIYVLGIAQDGGFPQAGCKKSCCENAWKYDSLRRFVVSLAIIDPESKERWIIEATPDFSKQLKMLDDHFNPKDKYGISGFFLTHAHIGHYAGLMQLGREVMGAQNIPVYAMPRMNDYLKNNGPWSLLVDLKNIDLKLLKADSTVYLNSRISITPFLVPHREEFTETVGYLIKGAKHSAVFIPDIDKWEKWNRKIEDYIAKCDYAFLDATFYKEGEIPGRNMKDIPHPFVQESMKRFKTLDEEEKRKIYFIHFNHTNPLINRSDSSYKEVLKNGFNVAEQGRIFIL